MKIFIDILYILAAIAIPVGICFLWVLPFREKKSTEPQQTAPATLVTREIRRGSDRSGRSRVGFNHVLIFQLSDSRKLELYSYEEEYGALREGMAGNLTWQGRYFVNWEAL